MITVSADIPPCLVCGKPLQPVFPDSDVVNQPNGATAFWTAGHYGSTVFDRMDGSTLNINICDDCLRETGRKYPERLLRTYTRTHHETQVLGYGLGTP